MDPRFSKEFSVATPPAAGEFKRIKCLGIVLSYIQVWCKQFKGDTGCDNFHLSSNLSNFYSWIFLEHEQVNSCSKFSFNQS